MQVLDYLLIKHSGFDIYLNVMVETLQITAILFLDCEKFRLSKHSIYYNFFFTLQNCMPADIQILLNDIFSIDF